MTINETKMTVKALQLSGYEMGTLKEARKTLNIIFNRLTSSDNMTRLYNIISGLDVMIEELEANDNSILEFHEEDK